MSEYPWDSIEQPPDEDRAGSPWFFAGTYQEFQRGLESLLAELEQHRNAVERIGLTASPFEEEVDYLRGMVEWGSEKLASMGNPPRGTVTVNGVSYRSLRYLKAGILFRAFEVERQKLAFLAQNHIVPRSVLSSFDARIEQLRGMAEMGKLSGLRPADVLFELIDAQMIPANSSPSP